MRGATKPRWCKTVIDDMSERVNDIDVKEIAGWCEALTATKRANSFDLNKLNSSWYNTIVLTPMQALNTIAAFKFIHEEIIKKGQTDIHIVLIKGNVPAKIESHDQLRLAIVGMGMEKVLKSRPTELPQTSHEFNQWFVPQLIGGRISDFTEVAVNGHTGNVVAKIAEFHKTMTTTILSVDNQNLENIMVGLAIDPKTLMTVDVEFLIPPSLSLAHYGWKYNDHPDCDQLQCIDRFIALLSQMERAANIARIRPKSL